MFEVNRDPNAADLHKFGWAMLGGFGVIALILWMAPALRGSESTLEWRGGTNQWTAVCLGMVGIILFACSRAPIAVARPVYVTWMSIVTPVGVFMSIVGLTLLFVLLLPVFSLVVRVGDPLRAKLSAGGSYWEDYKRYEPTLERMRRQF